MRQSLASLKPLSPLLLAGFLLAGWTPAWALVFGQINHLTVKATAGMSWNSNPTAQADGQADTIATSGLGVEFSRHAGILFVDGSAEANTTRYLNHPDLSALDPKLSLTISKARGRLTGEINVQAYRESRTDTEVNLRTTAWNTPLNLKLRYPFTSRYSLSSNTSFMRRSFEGPDALADYADFSEGLNLAYTLTSKLNFTSGYRVRFSKTSFDTRAQDHSATFGFSGALGPRLHGEVSAGYQARFTHPGGRNFTGVNASADVTWSGPHSWSVTGGLTRDFGTTARAANTEELTASLSTDKTLTKWLSAGAGASLARTAFLDAGTDRQDHTLSFDLHAVFRLTSHLDVSLSAARSSTTSNHEPFSLKQNGYALTAISRW